MRITRESPDELVLDHAPWGLALALALCGLVLAGVFLGSAMVLGGAVLGGTVFGLALVTVGLGSLAAFAERTQLWLSRPAGTLTHRRRTLFGLTEVSHPLAEVSYATIQTGGGSRGAILRRAAILLADHRGQIPLTQTFATGPGPERAAAAVNRWLARKA